MKFRILLVVTLAWLPILFPQAGNMSAIRSVRALRPLRALKRVPGMPVLVGSILQSMPALGNVAGLMGFVFLIFGIVGFNLFKGVLHYRCADPAVLTLGSRALSALPPAAGDSPAALAASAWGQTALGSVAAAWPRLLKGGGGSGGFG